MRKICLHWTAGSTKPNHIDLKHYHFIRDGSGKLHLGRFKPEDNIPPLKPGEYAAHCGGGNSDTVGYALCGGPKNYKFGEITRLSWEAACLHIAELCVKYKIPIDSDHIYTHHLFGKRNPRTSSAGKIDIIELPWDSKSRNKVDSILISTVKWYHKNYVTKEVGIVDSPVPDNGE